MSDVEGLARAGVEAALAAGAGEAEAWCEESTSRRVEVYDGAIESLSDAGSRGIGVRAFLDGRVGHAYGTDLGDEALRALGTAAHAAAEVADPDEHAGLPDEAAAADVPGLFSEAMADFSNDDRVDLALAIERAARGQAGVTQVETVVYADSEGAAAIANSRGFASSYRATHAWSYASAFAGEGEDLMTGMGIGVGRDPGALDPEAIGREAADRAVALVGARPVASRRCPVVLDPFVSASFAGFIGSMLSADAVQRGRSLFADKLGEEVAEAAFELTDDGRDAVGHASSPFDGEGSPTRRTPLIADGRLKSYLYDCRTARKDGRATTGNAQRGSYRSTPSVGTSNLLVEPGSETLEQLLARAGGGLYVTDVAGLHSGVNPVSGTFSVGATGRLFSDGELARPVREVTIASDLVGMLRAVVAAGSERRWIPMGGSVRAVPLLISEMSVSGS